MSKFDAFEARLRPEDLQLINAGVYPTRGSGHGVDE
jgi:hypothetical protein